MAERRRRVGAPSPHALGGADHSASTKALLDGKISNATLISTIAAEISAIAAKATPVGADLVLIEDSAAANAKKSATISNLMSATDVRAATRVVGSTNATDANIADAITNLPAGGGFIFVREGTFALAATISITKRVVIIGAGRGATILDLGSNAIAAFTIPDPVDLELHFEGFTIRGDGTVGQKGFDYQRIAGASKTSRFVDVEVGITGAVVEAGITTAAGGIGVGILEDCDFLNGNNASSDFFNGNGVIHLRNVRAVDSGLVQISSLEVHAYDCDLEIQSQVIGTTIREFHFVRCRISGDDGLTAGVVSSSLVDCEIDIVPGGGGTQQITISSGSDESLILGCRFAGVTTRCINIASGNARAAIKGNDFGSGFTSEAVRTQGTQARVVGNSRCVITEASPADENVYSSNQGFDGSTVVGADSVIEDANTRTVTTTPVTLDLDDRTVLADSSGGNRTLNLPAAASAIYHIYIIKKIAAANTVTLDPSGAETIDGDATLDLDDDDDVVVIQSDGTEWRILSISLTAVSPVRSFCRTITPATLAANVNNYDPGDGECYRPSASGATRDITGLAPTGGNDDGNGNGRKVRLINVGAEDIRIMHQNASSTAANRFLNESGSDFTISTNEAVEAVYDPVTLRWRVFEA